MGYDEKRQALARTKYDLIVIELDFCSNTYGTSPCTAAGTPGHECYNTYPTCHDTSNFTKSSKIYKFTNINKPLPFDGVRPYIISLNELATEIQEKKSITQRVKVVIKDEPDELDIDTDPYYNTRKTRGTYWKKWLARNPNYKGRVMKRYEGYDGLAEGEFVLKFQGILENVEINNDTVTLEATDILKKLTEQEYPIYLVNKLAYINPFNPSTAVPFTFLEVQSIADLETLNSEYGDYARVVGFVIDSFDVSGGITSGGSLPIGKEFYWYVYAKDSNGRIITRYRTEYTVTPWGGSQTMDLTWTAVTGYGTITYDIYRENVTDGEVKKIWPDWPSTPTTFSDAGYTGVDADLIIRSEAWFRRIPLLGWYWLSNTFMTIKLDTTANLDASGYIMIEKEIFYYFTKSDAAKELYIEFAQRGLFKTDVDRHAVDTVIRKLYKEAPDNPFTLMKKILTDGGISSSFRTAKFDDYETAGFPIDFSTDVIVKQTKISEIYYDCVNAADCISWVNELGKVDILKRSDMPSTYKTLTDEANIIADSTSVDMNYKSRKTRWLLYWQRFDVTKSLTDNDAYSRLNMVVDTIAEGPNLYNDQIEDIQFTTWINDDCGTPTEVNDYIDELLAARKIRQTQAQELIKAAVEMKDSNILTGEIIKLSTDELQEMNGNNYSNVKFRVVKREPNDNIIELTLLRDWSYMLILGDDFEPLKGDDEEFLIED